MHLLVSELYIYQNARCNNKKKKKLTIYVADVRKICAFDVRYVHLPAFRLLVIFFSKMLHGSLVLQTS